MVTDDSADVGADTAASALTQIRAAVHDVPDFPQPGIVFKDLTPLLRDHTLLAHTVSMLAEPFADSGVTAVVGMEARGFIFGSLVAMQLHAGFVPLRRPGKLPRATEAIGYELEYGSAELEMHRDALGTGDRVLLVDDLIATGGTAAASLALIRRCGADVCGAGFVIELEALGGRALLGDCRVHSVLRC
jgi:adenine phosphoribosyltransferase